jgi:chromate transporter
MSQQPANAEPSHDVLPARDGRVAEVARLFLRLGFTAFGGPPAHVALMEDEVVSRRRWVDRQHFLDLLSAVNFIPGPNSTELAIHLGHIRAGYRGLLAAGVCFITPAALIILPIAWAYVTYGTLPQVRHVMAGINAAIIAVIVAALWRFARSAVTDAFTACVAAGAIVAAVVSTRYFGSEPDLAILAAAAVAGALRRHVFTSPAPLLLPIGLTTPATAAAATPATLSGNLLHLFLFFLKVGGTLFGSGYVLVSYLQTGLVDRLGWLDKQQLLDAIAVGQVTPGPLLTTATFIGYVLGHAFSGGSTAWAVVGAIVATVGIFLPSFVLVGIIGPFLLRIRTHPAARGALDAMNAAAVALIAVVAVRLGQQALTGWVAVAIAAVTFVGMFHFRLNATWFVGLGALSGLFFWA